MILVARVEPNRVRGHVMIAPLTVRHLLDAARLELKGPLRWTERIPDDSPGVYVVSLTSSADGACDPVERPPLPADEAARWIQGEPIVYIGRAGRSVRRRMDQFYRHIYGRRAPHRGGQAVKLIPPERIWVFWALSGDPVAAERLLIDTFCKHAGDRLPYANRRR